MKRKTKLALGGLTLALGAVVLSGCTASFCTVTDQAHMLYAFDYGASNYYTEGDFSVVAYIDGKADQMAVLDIKYQRYSDTDRTGLYEYCSTYKAIDENATKNGIRLPTIEFLSTLDSVVLGHALYADGITTVDAAVSTIKNKSQLIRDYTSKDYTTAEKGVLDKYGYLKYEDSYNERKNLWTNFDVYVDEVKTIIGADKCPSNDYWKLYKQALNNGVAANRSCLATDTGDYGAYGPRGIAVEIEGKKWTDWKGLLEFLLVWPIGALIDVLAKGMLVGGIMNGWAQLLSILVVTVLIRGIMLIFTIKQSASSAKMNELQPELQKIQAKYPNANTNQYDKQRLAAETSKLYKKHKINPLSSLLVMIIQFPVFICVWGAMQGSAYLSSGQIWGLRLSDPIGNTMFNASNWATGAAETALGLFILMAAAQTVAMLLPQWIQKKKAKEVAKLGKNPAQNQTANRMKWFTYIMLAMIIFMGFSLASGMGVYWFFGALVSIAQTLIMQKVNDAKAKKAKYGGKQNNNVSAKKKGK